MIRRLSLTKRSSCSSLQDDSNRVSIRDGCPDFVSWDSDDGMFDLQPPSRQSFNIHRHSSNDQDDEENNTNGRNRIYRGSMGSVAEEDDIFQHMWPQQPRQEAERRSTGGIAIATEAENRDVLVDIMNESVVLDTRKHDGVVTTKKQKKGRRKSLRKSLGLPKFKKSNKKQDLFRASALV